MVLPAGCPHSVGVNGRELQTKSQNPCCSLGLEVGGGGSGYKRLVHYTDTFMINTKKKMSQLMRFWYLCEQL